MLNWMLMTFKELFRDRSSLFFVIVFPVLMVAILGNMLSELDNPDTAIGQIRIATFAEESAAGDASPGSVSLEKHMGQNAETAAVSSFTDTLADHDGIEIVKAQSAEAAREKTMAGDTDASIIFSSPLSIEVSEGGDLYKNRAVLLIAQSFAREYAAFRTAALHDPESFIQIMQDNKGEIPAASGLAEDKDLGVSRTMIDYYAVTMIVMIIFMGGGISGATSMFQMRQDGSLRRICASPRSRTRLFLESVIGALPQSVIQAGIIMILSTGFLGANYAASWQGNLLLFAFFVILGLAVGAVFMVIGLFVKVNPYIPILALMWALLFISGTFSKDMLIPGLSEYLPMNIVQQAVFDLTIFGRPEQLLLVMGMSAAVLTVACVIGSALYKRKEIML
jgi:ABC-2 type transport system permease protein